MPIGSFREACKSALSAPVEHKLTLRVSIASKRSNTTRSTLPNFPLCLAIRPSYIQTRICQLSTSTGPSCKAVVDAFLNEDSDHPRQARGKYGRVSTHVEQIIGGSCRHGWIDPTAHDTRCFRSRSLNGVCLGSDCKNEVLLRSFST